MLRDRANIIIAVIYNIMYRLSIYIFTSDLSSFCSKGQGQGHALFDCKYLVNSDGWENFVIVSINTVSNIF